jgi:excisionase family DNA binding protein
MTGGEDLLSLAEVAQLLGVHYMTAYRYVRTGRLRATKRGGSWVVDAGDLEQFRNAAPGAATSPPPGDAPDGSQEGSPARAGTKSGARTGAKSGAEAGARSSATRRAYPGRLEDRLVHGDEGGAWAVVEEALGSSMTPEEVYTAVMAPAMASIGERWARHELDIEDEHMASTIVQRLAGRLGPRFARRGRHRGTVVLGAPAGDAHGIPVMLMADLLRGRGFDVVDLGADTPPAAFARAAAGVDRLVAVGICATRADNDGAISAAVSAIAEATGAPVILGGQGVDDATEAAILVNLGGSAPSLRRSRGTADAIACFEGATTTPV